MVSAVTSSPADASSLKSDLIARAHEIGFDACRVARQKKDSSSERICRQWVTYIDREKNRRDQLRAAASG